jgi:hypothetical protein
MPDRDSHGRFVPEYDRGLKRFLSSVEAIDQARKAREREVDAAVRSAVATIQAPPPNGFGLSLAQIKRAYDGCIELRPSDFLVTLTINAWREQHQTP